MLINKALKINRPMQDSVTGTNWQFRVFQLLCNSEKQTDGHQTTHFGLCGKLNNFMESKIKVKYTNNIRMFKFNYLNLFM
jgi:regulation of enolase protein 1 (concanavalin A-like superfamily)